MSAAISADGSYPEGSWDQKDQKAGRGQSNPHVIVTVADRRAPLAAVALPVVASPCLMMAPAPIKPTPVTMQDVCLIRQRAPEDGDCGLNEAAARHRD